MSSNPTIARTLIRVLGRTGISLLIAFPMALPFTVLFAEAEGEAINRMIVLPLSSFLDRLGVQNYGWAAAAGGSLVISIPYAILTLVVFHLTGRIGGLRTAKTTLQP